jgi:hypothetical protein
MAICIIEQFIDVFSRPRDEIRPSCATGFMRDENDSLDGQDVPGQSLSAAAQEQCNCFVAITGEEVSSKFSVMRLRNS